MNTAKRIEYYSRAAYPALYIPTHEEDRVVLEIVNGLESIKRPDDPEIPAKEPYTWSCTEGLRRWGDDTATDDSGQDPMEMLELFVSTDRNNAVFIVRDFHLFLEEPVPQIIRLLKDALQHAKNVGKMLIFVGCRTVLPPEIEKLVTVIDYHLPSADELADMVLDPLAETAGVALSTEERRTLAEAGSGLTTFEYQDALALSLVVSKSERGETAFCPDVVYREKVQTIKKSGLLEIVEGDIRPDDLGGLDRFKAWMGKCSRIFSPEAKDYGLPDPKGILLIGVPGAGKSLSAKVSAAMLGGIPLLKMDMGRMFAGVVGASEENMRAALALAEAVSPCVLWIDEIERGLSGGESSGKTDGGTTNRMIGTMLNWMQDKSKPVFIFATGNDVSGLPPQLLRKGRFDKLWFVDLPNATERQEIWSIMVRRKGRNPEDYNLRLLGEATEGWTGAEIEALWEEALLDAFASDKLDQPKTDQIIHLSKNTTPLSKSSLKQIEQMRKWADQMAEPATTKTTKKTAPSVGSRAALN